jgi:hypothetical protein
LIQDSPHPIPRLSLFGKTNQRDLARPFHRYGQNALMLQTIPGDSPRHDPSTLRQKVPQQTDIFKIDRRFINAKSTGLAALKKPPTSPSAIPIGTFSSFHARLRLLRLFVLV